MNDNTEYGELVRLANWDDEDRDATEHLRRAVDPNEDFSSAAELADCLGIDEADLSDSHFLSTFIVAARAAFLEIAAKI